MELVIALDPRWVRYIETEKILVFYEVWQPGGTDLFCFDYQGGQRWPYEYAGLNMVPPFRKHVRGLGALVTFKGRSVARFESLDKGICLRVCMHLHKQPNKPDERVPHHVATALLTVNAEYASALYRHGDIGWMKVPVCGVASLGPKPRSRDPYYSPHVITDRLERIFRATIMPDYTWLKHNVRRMHHSMHPIGRSLHFSSIPTLPVYQTMNRFSGDANDRFMLSAGGPGCANWNPARGRFVPPVTDDWLKQSVTQALMLRGLHSKANWDAEGMGPYPTGSETEKYQQQFIACVDACLLGSKRPGGSQKGRDVLHAWGRAPINDVITGVGSHVSTRRYIYDHVHYWAGNVLKTNMVSDEFTLAFPYGGDCEDCNTVIKIVIEYILRQMFTDPFLKAVQVCLAIAGVPCCVGGTARQASVDLDNECGAGHVFGFSVPHRTMARLIWGPDVSMSEILAEVNFYLTSRGHGTTSAWVLQCVQPHIYESIMSTSAEYVDRDVLKRDKDLERFEVFLEACKHAGVNTIVDDFIMAQYPLALPHTDEHRDTKYRHGFLVHGHILRFFVGALPTLFRREFRTRHASLEIDPAGLARPAQHDLALDWTIAFIPVRGETLGMPSEHLHSEPDKYRLVSMTRFDDKILEDVHALLDYERPFVPLVMVPMPTREWPFDTQPGPIAELEKHIMVFFVYADRVDAEKTRRVEEELVTRLKPKRVTSRRFGWCMAYVFSFV